MPEGSINNSDVERRLVKDIPSLMLLLKRRGGVNGLNSGVSATDEL